MLAIAELLRFSKDWKKAPGVSYKEGLLFYNTPCPAPLELDSLPFPAWHHIKRELYRMPIIGEPFLMVGVSRGRRSDAISARTPLITAKSCG